MADRTRDNRGHRMTQPAYTMHALVLEFPGAKFVALAEASMICDLPPARASVTENASTIRKHALASAGRRR